MKTAFPAISLFSGGGGLDLGAFEAGFCTRVAVEYEKYACKTLRRNQGHIVRGRSYLSDCKILETDIRFLTVKSVLDAAGLRVGEAALLLAGPPCVSFSFAGRRQGLQSDVGMLFEEFVRILLGTKPLTFIFESVKGLVSAPGADGEPGGALATILDVLSRTGYRITWKVVDAADYGVPQHRHRLFIIGHRNGIDLPFPQATHCDPNLISLIVQNTSPWSTVREALGSLPAPAPAGTLPNLANHVERLCSEHVRHSFSITPPGKRNPIYKRDRLEWNKPAKTVRAQGKPRADGAKNGSHQSIHPSADRQITVRETARLQTFPDWYEFDETLVNAYRVVGDAVPPLLAQAIASNIMTRILLTDKPVAIAKSAARLSPSALVLHRKRAAKAGQAYG